MACERCLCVCNGVYKCLKTVIQSWVWFESLVLCWMAVSWKIALKCFLNTLHEHVPATHRVFQARRQMKGWRAERTAGKCSFFHLNVLQNTAAFNTTAAGKRLQSLRQIRTSIHHKPRCWTPRSALNVQKDRELQALPQTHTRGAKEYLDPLLRNCAYYKQIHVYKNAVSNLQNETQKRNI